MQFEEFDNKAKEAADHHHPAYDEQAWAKMQKLLDKQLPQQEDNRKRFILFFLLFLGLGAAGIFVAKKWKAGNSAPVTEQSVQSRQPLVTTPATSKGNDGPIQINKEVNANNDELTNTDNTSSANRVITGNNKTIRPAVERKQIVRHNNAIKNKPALSSNISSVQVVTIDKTNSVGNNNNGIKNNPKETKTTAALINKNINPVIDSKSKADSKQETVKTDQPLTTNSIPALTAESGKSTAINKEEELLVQHKENKEKVRKKKNSFFFSISTAPDVSFAGKEKFGTIKLLGGAGLGYTFNNRLTVRAGFYSGRKVYTASPDSYHPPAPFYTYYPYLEKVDANCKVYEIPLSLSYNFGHSSKQNWFASGSVSSYIMKSETYDYYYKTTPSGPTVNRKRTISNVNKHYFSALTFSGGYQRNINRNISFMVEPYLKIPLSGVGYGKVKLHSSGVLLSVVIKPFASKKEKPAFRR